MKRTHSMTKMIRAALALCVLLCLAALPACAETEGDYTYTVTNGESSITGYTGTETALIIPDTLGGYPVTSIGRNAFKYGSLVTLLLPDTVTYIDNYAFKYCSDLCVVSFSDNLLGVGNEAFYGCTSLSELAFPEGMTTIAEYAFYGCTGLSSLSFPSSMRYIHDYAFSGCSGVRSVYFSDDITYMGRGFIAGVNENCRLYANRCSNSALSLTSLNTSFYDPEYPHLKLQTSTAGNGSYVFTVVDCAEDTTCAALPENVIAIADNAFKNCSLLTSISIPDSVSSIGSNAFYGCSQLREIVIPEGVVSIGEYAFFSCSYLSSVSLPQSLVSIGAHAFRLCSALSSISIPDGVTAIESYTFAICSALSHVTLPDGLASIGGYAFENAASLAQLDLPANIETIASTAFSGCKFQPYAQMDSQTAVALTAAGYGFYAPGYPCLLLKAYETNGVRTFTFANYTGTDTALSIPEGVTTIAASALSGNTTLTSVTIPDSVTSIGNNAFMNCTALISISIPDSVTAISEKAFFNCTALTDIYLSENITSVGTNAFYGCPAKLHASRLSATALLLSVTDPEYPQLRIKAYNTDGTRTYAIFHCETTAEAVSFPENTTIIASSAFSGCTALASIAIPEGVTSISFHAFNGCTALTSISLPSSLTELGQSAFAGCSALKTVDMAQSDHLSELPNYAFENCSALTTLYLPEDIAAIGTNSFYNCLPVFYVNVDSTTALTLTDKGYSFADVQYPGVLLKAYETDGVRRFTVTGSLEDITSAVIPEGTTIIAAGAFKNRTGLLSVSIPEGVADIGNSAFSGCTSLREVTLPQSLTTIGYSVFSDCETLTAVHLPDSLTSVGTQLFSGCTALTDVTLPAGMTDLPSSTFYGCVSLTDISLPQGLASIGSYAFDGCTALRSIILPQSLTALGTQAFYGCTSLASLSIPDVLTSVGSNALPGTILLYADPDSAAAVALTAASHRFCTPGYEDFRLTASDSDDGTRTITLAQCTMQDRKQVVIPEGIHVIGNSVFANWTELASVTFPSTLREIGDYAFRYCSAISSLSIPEGLTTLGRYSLGDCTGLASISLPQSLRTISYDAFYNCDSLTEVVIPDGVTTIQGGAFDSCDSILWVNPNTPAMRAFAATYYDFRFPEYPQLSFKSVVDESSSITLTVADCDQTATAITLPQDVTAIGQYAFSGCSALETITLPDTITTLEEDAFYGCSSLRMLTLPGSITSIGSDAFGSCYKLTSLTIPAGVTSLPSGMAQYCSAMTSAIIPASVTSIASNTFDNKLSTVYCWRGSYADTWATSSGRHVIYLDGIDIEDYISLTGETALARDHGESFLWRGLVSLAPLPFDADYTLRCTSSDPSIASVLGDIVSVHKAGTAKLTVTVDELPWLSHTITLRAYNPVESFTLPTAVFMPAGGGYDKRVTLKPENVSPSDTNPMYSWTENNSYWTDEYEERTYWPQSSAYVTTVTASAQSGVSRTCNVVTYQTIGTLRFKAFPAHVDVGMTIAPGVILFLDGVAYVDEPALYTLSSSNTAVVKPTVDGRLKVVGKGTATITVTALGGQTASQTITIEDLSVFTLPAALKVISDEAFAGSTANVIVIPEGCTTIGSRAFAGCTDLLEITIPASVTEIAADAFSGCSGVTVITPSGSAAQAMAEANGFVWQAM